MRHFALIITCVMFASAIRIAVVRADDESKTKQPPHVGDNAPEFKLKNLKGELESLAEQQKKGSVVLVVLRGYPGYQCPICTKQFGELMGKAKEFADAKATVVFVYPGPANDLDKWATEFIGGKTFPDNYHFLIDPDFKFTEPITFVGTRRTKLPIPPASSSMTKVW